jgi:hypothetical protein
VWLYESQLRLIGQVHSHPTQAYRSGTDDDFALATTAGCLSVVVPDFAQRPFSLRDCAVYRLQLSGEWQSLSHGEVDKLIRIDS